MRWTGESHRVVVSGMELRCVYIGAGKFYMEKTSLRLQPGAISDQHVEKGESDPPYPLRL